MPIGSAAAGAAPRAAANKRAAEVRRNVRTILDLQQGDVLNLIVRVEHKVPLGWTKTLVPCEKSRVGPMAFYATGIGGSDAAAGSAAPSAPARTRRRRSDHVFTMT